MLGRVLAVQLDVEETVVALALRRTFAGLGHDPAEQLAQRANSSRAHRGALTGRHRDGARHPAGAAPGQQRLRVAEVAAVRVIEQGIRAANDARVEGRHHEGPRPRLEVRVVFRLETVGTVRPAAFALRIEAIGIGEQAAHVFVARHFLHHRQQAGGGAAAETAAEAAHAVLDAAAGHTVRALHLALQKEDSDVGRDAVETARVHDASAAARRRLAVAVDHAANPLQLAGQIAVVRAGGDTRGDQLRSVERVGSDRRADDRGPSRQRREKRLVLAVADDQRQVGGRRAESGAHRFELVATAAADRPAKRRRAAVALGQVLGDQRAGEPGRSPDDDVELSCGHSITPRPLSARRSSRCGPSRGARPNPLPCSSPTRATSSRSKSRREW